jgi:ribosomal protein L32
MKNKILLPLSILTILWFATLPALAHAQAALSLRLSKDFGYSSGTGKIQGTFTMKASGPDNLSRVVFYMDGKQIGEVSQSPFNLQFSTDSYTLGIHTLSVTGYTTSGEALQSNEIKAEFVTASQGWQAALKIAIPIIVLAFGAMLLSAVGPALMGRGKKSSVPLGAPRNYGAFGGTVCPKCGRPYSRHIWGMNLGVGKLDRCPHCGKWSIARRATPQELRMAEEAELQMAQNESQVPTQSEEEKLRKELDDSRYRDI